MIALSMLSLTACDSLDMKGMFFCSGPSVEDRVEESLAWNKAHGEPVLHGVSDNYRFYVCSDTHVDDSVARVVRFLAREQADPDSRFSIIMGDLANKAGEEPYSMIGQAIDSRTAQGGVDPNPCYIILGNHDLYFDCYGYYSQYFHTSTYTLVVETVGGKKDLYIFLDSGNATHGARQMVWLREVLSHRDEYRHCIVCTHTSLFRNSYDYSTTPAANFPLDEYYTLLDLMSKSRVDLFLMGHFHHKEWHTLSGVEYVMADNLNESVEVPSYVVVDCSDESVKWQYKDLY